MSVRVVAASAIILLVVPVVAIAHGDPLRDKIHEDLTRDPRTVQMTEVEIELLIEAIASQAAMDGTAAVLLESENSFDYSAAFAAQDLEEGMSLSPMAIALIALGAILLALGTYLALTRGKHRGAPSEI